MRCPKLAILNFRNGDFRNGNFRTGNFRNGRRTNCCGASASIAGPVMQADARGPDRTRARFG